MFTLKLEYTVDISVIKISKMQRILSNATCCAHQLKFLCTLSSWQLHGYLSE
jgi:hypothetical protein